MYHWCVLVPRIKVTEKTPLSHTRPPTRPPTRVIVRHPRTEPHVRLRPPPVHSPPRRRSRDDPCISSVLDDGLKEPPPFPPAPASPPPRHPLVTTTTGDTGQSIPSTRVRWSARAAAPIARPAACRNVTTAAEGLTMTTMPTMTTTTTTRMMMMMIMRMITRRMMLSMLTMREPHTARAVVGPRHTATPHGGGPYRGAVWRIQLAAPRPRLRVQAAHERRKMSSHGPRPRR